MMSQESFQGCESAARQLLVFNRIIEPVETKKKIDLVSKESVQNIAKIISGPLTIS